MGSIRGINFSRLSLMDALDLAVLIEEEARDRYVELADQLATHHTEEAAAFFRKMSKIEELHRTKLVAKRSARFGAHPVHVNRSKLFDVEAPEYDEARTFMTVRQALEVAQRSEEKAHAFFVGALAEVKDPDVTALFTELRDEEVEHQALVKAELARLPPDDPGRSSDYSDDPVGL